MDTDEILSPIVDKAIRTAVRAHRKQTRKGSDMPYIAHPAAVASILTEVGFGDPHIVAAAWLHDVVEDTAVTLHELVAEFPPEVVALVNTMSEHKTDAAGNQLPWKTRKAQHLSSMAMGSVDELAVMLADKLHNMTSMQQDRVGQPNFWDRFNAPREDLLGYYESMVALADNQNDDRLKMLQTACVAALENLKSEG